MEDVEKVRNDETSLNGANGRLGKVPGRAPAGPRLPHLRAYVGRWHGDVRAAATMLMEDQRTPRKKSRTRACSWRRRPTRAFRGRGFWGGAKGSST